MNNDFNDIISDLEAMKHSFLIDAESHRDYADGIDDAIGYIKEKEIIYIQTYKALIDAIIQADLTVFAYKTLINAGISNQELGKLGYTVPVLALPDRRITQADMIAHGYTWTGMLPIKGDVAKKISEAFNVEVYRLWDDGTECAMDDEYWIDFEECFDEDERDTAIFGIQLEDWERITGVNFGIEVKDWNPEHDDPEPTI